MYKTEARERTCYECGKKDHMIKDCPIAKKKGKRPAPGHRLKKIEEVDKTQEDVDGTLTDEGEVEEIQDFVEGDSQCFCTMRISCTVKAVFQSMASSSAQKHKAQPSVLTRSTPSPLSRHPELTLLPIALSHNTATFDQTWRVCQASAGSE